MKGIIYEYYNSTKNRYYIGQTRDRFAKRDWSHRHARAASHSWFDYSYTKHPEQFTHKILVTIESPSKKLLVETLNMLEIAFISQYKTLGRKLYNFLKGGNVGWEDRKATDSMLNALSRGRQDWNLIQKNNKKSPEECRLSHKQACKKYKERHPDRYKQYCIDQNIRRAEYKRQWYLKNRERILAKLHAKNQSLAGA